MFAPFCHDALRAIGSIEDVVLGQIRGWIKCIDVVGCCGDELDDHSSKRCILGVNRRVTGSSYLYHEHWSSWTHF